MIPRIAVDEYSRFIADEYLGPFISEGGAAVKFAVVPDSATADALKDSLSAAIADIGMTAVFLDAARAKVHLIQHIFFGVAAELDWVSLAQSVVSEMAESTFGPQVAGANSVASIAARLEIDEVLVRTQLMQALTNRVAKDYSLAKDFRIAMTQVCLPELMPEAFTTEGRDAILEWLRGELRLIGAVKDRHIFHKIGRHSARAMLSSAARWVAKAGGGGLVLVVDIRQLTLSRREFAAPGENYYTPAGVMDAFEVLRQFIDATDEMENFMLLVIATDESLDDSNRRGFPSYQALKNRIWDDVRDRGRVNPYAPMLRIESTMGGTDE